MKERACSDSKEQLCKESGNEMYGRKLLMTTYVIIHFACDRDQRGKQRLKVKNILFYHPHVPGPPFTVLLSISLVIQPP